MKIILQFLMACVFLYFLIEITISLCRKLCRSTKEPFEFDSLPLELQQDILSRLSQRQLHHCWCVSTHWRDLINSQDFNISYQLRHRPNDHSEGSRKIIALDSSAVISIKFSADIVCSVVTPNHGLPSSNVGHTTVIGSFNGLVCFRSYIFNYPPRPTPSKYTLYNLATGEYKVLPALVPKYSYPEKTDHFFGFGYDSVGDDYKVVCILNKFGKHVVSEEEYLVYSFKANTWKSISKPFPKSCPVTPVADYAIGVSSHNALHWIRSFHRMKNGVSEEGYQIIGFDLGTYESFKLPTPLGIRSYYQDPYYYLPGYLTTLRGCLHIISAPAPYQGPLNMWVMKEYGIRQPWTRLYCLSWNSVTKFVNPFPKYNWPLSICAYSEDGKEILIGYVHQKNGDAIRLNLETREGKVVHLLDQCRM